MTIRFAWSLAGGALVALMLATFSDSDAASFRAGSAGSGDHFAGRRGGGRPGGGGGRPGGGGGARPGGGGARPGGGGISRPPSGGLSRPSAPNISRPSGPSIGQRPNIGSGSRPNVGGGGAGIANRPSLPHTPNIPNFNPGGGARPGGGGQGIANLPGMGGHPSTRPGAGGGGIAGGGNTRPSIPRPDGPRPTPPIASRPGAGGGGIANRPSIGDRPNLPNRPDGIRPGGDGIRPGGDGIRPGGDGWAQNRPDTRPTRPTRPDWAGGDHNTIIGGGGNNFIGGGNNINIGNGNGNINNRPWVGDHMNHWNNNWNNHWDHCHHWHDNWYHGCWNGNWGGGWAAAGLAWGTSMWAFNSMAYDSGYYGYSNPYYEPTVVVQQVPVLDYSQPVQMNYADTPPEGQPEPPPTAAQQQGIQTFDQARAAFKAGDYRQAGSLTEQAMKAMPQDPVLHEFRALCLFALGDYKQAAAAINALLAVSPGWDWTTMASLYDSTATYEAQLRKLEEAAKAEPKRPELQFLLGYHYLITGNTDAAKIVLANAVKLAPGDRVAAQLLKTIGGDVPASPATPPMPSPMPSAADIQLDIRGDWKATRSGQPTIGLSLKEDGKFTWTVTQPGKKTESFGGTFTADGDMLMLERSEGGALIGKVKPLSDKSFSFRMVGAPDTDPGLTFTR